MKETLNKIELALVSLEVLAVAGAAVACSIPAIKHIEDSPLTQTYELQEKTNTLNYRYSKGERLGHNNGKPIYVSISSEFNEDQKAIIVETLDHVFGLVGDINDNYKYEIVENVNRSQYANKTRINFRLNDSLTNTKTLGNNNWVAKTVFLTSKKGSFIQTNDISFNKTLSLENFGEVVLHEVLHAFGIADTYNSKNCYFNSHIERYMAGQKINLITPNDYKLLLAMYTKNNEEDIMLLNIKAEEYAKFYYNEYTKFMKSKNSIPVDDSIDLTALIASNATLMQIMRIKTEQDPYTLQSFDKNGKLIESCSGKIYKTNGQIFLKNVHLNNFTKNKGAYFDVQVGKDKETGLWAEIINCPIVIGSPNPSRNTDFEQ